MISVMVDETEGFEAFLQWRKNSKKTLAKPPVIEAFSSIVQDEEMLTHTKPDSKFDFCQECSHLTFNDKDKKKNFKRHENHETAKNGFRFLCKYSNCSACFKNKFHIIVVVYEWSHNTR